MLRPMDSSEEMQEKEIFLYSIHQESKTFPRNLIVFLKNDKQVS